MYNFKEKELGPDFAKEKLTEFKAKIEAGRSFVILSMPGVGVSYFLRYLTMQSFAHFVHIDLYSLPALTQHEFYKLLNLQLGGKSKEKSDSELLSESKKLLSGLSNKGSKIVLIFSRFDQLKKEFNPSFLSNIQSLATVAPAVVLIFTSIKPLDELAPDAVSGGNLNFYSEEVYFPPYSKSDLEKLLKLDSLPAKEDLEKLINLSGGHFQLLQILLRSQKIQNLSLDRFVRLQMKELVDYLSYTQRKQLQKVALGKTVKEVDEYLLGVGMIEKFQIFTPLLAAYIKTNLPIKLPVKEAKLFKLLRKNMGSVVSKDEIFAEVWGPAEAGENATDWALDALIYRLRKHPFIQSHNYIIESHKKVGYTLIQT